MTKKGYTPSPFAKDHEETIGQEEIVLDPGKVEGTFTRVLVSLDGKKPISLYADITTEIGRPFLAAEDMLKAQRIMRTPLAQDEKTFHRYLQYLEGLVVLPKPRDPDTGEELEVSEATFYFTKYGFDNVIRSEEYLERVLNDAARHHISPIYRTAEVITETIEDPSNVVYKDKYQIAVKR